MFRASINSLVVVLCLVSVAKPQQSEEESAIRDCLRNYVEVLDLEARFNLCTERAQQNLLASTLYGISRFANNRKAAREVFSRFSLDFDSMPPAANSSMSQDDLLKLRDQQQEFILGLFDSLGERTAEFGEAVRQIRPINFKPDVEFGKFRFSEDRLSCSVEVISNATSRAFNWDAAFEKVDGRWLFDGRKDDQEFRLSPSGFLKVASRSVTPVMIRNLVNVGKLEDAAAKLDSALRSQPEDTILNQMDSILASYWHSTNPDVTLKRSRALKTDS